MEQTVVSIRMETNKKMQFENIAEMMGVTVTQLFNIFVNRIIAEKKLPFPLEVPINP
jgi:addiction module RelB/DinJ family antitoxin